MKSSSFININGDKKQNKISISCYLLINLFQNIYYSFFSKKFKILKFLPKKKSYSFKNYHSISRKLCGVFWKNVNWKILLKSIGKFNICEIGVGNGNYFKSDILIKEKYIEKYQGYDVKKFDNWKKIMKKNFSYRKFNGYDFQKIVTRKNNLYISQSCLEHVKNDLNFFREIKKNANATSKKIILMHCLPSPFCLFTYLTHGYRQYNIENLNRISDIMGKDNVFIVKLGNLKLNLEHLNKTTIPLIFKKKNLMTEQSKSYYSKTNKLILKNKKTSIFTSSFLVLIGMINFEKKEKEKVVKKIFS